MIINYNDELNGFIPIKREVSWDYNGIIVTLKFDSVVDAFFLSNENMVIICDGFLIYKYSLLGKLIGYFKIKLPNGYSLRGFNKNNKAKYGFSVLLYPEKDVSRNKWGDIVQFEVDIKNECIGSALDIYR